MKRSVLIAIALAAGAALSGCGQKTVQPGAVAGFD